MPNTRSNWGTVVVGILALGVIVVVLWRNFTIRTSEGTTDTILRQTKPDGLTTSSGAGDRTGNVVRADQNPTVSKEDEIRLRFERIDRDRLEVLRKGYESFDHTPVPLLRLLRYKVDLIAALRAYPDEALKRYGPIATGEKGASLIERQEAVQSLSILITFGHQAAYEALLRTAWDNDPRLSELAVAKLSELPRASVLSSVSILTAKANQGSATAIRGLEAFYDDPQVSKDLQSQWQALQKNSDNDAVKAQLSAIGTSTEHMNLLASPGSTEKLTTMIRAIDSQEYDLGDAQWAIRIAVRLSRQDLVGALRDRIDAIYKVRDVWFSKEDWVESELDVPELFDESLWALQRLGGPLRDNEVERLRKFGLVGDPQQLIKERDAARKSGQR